MTEVDSRIDRRTFLFGALAAGVQAATADTSPRTFSQWLAASAKAREAALASCLDRIRALDGDIRAWVQVLPQSPTGKGKLLGIPFQLQRARLYRRRSVHAFGDMTQPAQDVVQLPALRQREAHLAVARKLSGAGQDQIAGTGESGERFGTASELHPQARDFGQSARDQGGAGVGAQAQAVGDSGGDSHDVLYRTPDLHPGDIGAEIDA